MCISMSDITPLERARSMAVFWRTSRLPSTYYKIKAKKQEAANETQRKKNTREMGVGVRGVLVNMSSTVDVIYRAAYPRHPM